MEIIGSSLQHLLHWRTWAHQFGLYGEDNVYIPIGIRTPESQPMAFRFNEGPIPALMRLDAFCKVFTLALVANALLSLLNF
jgi:hypothetical protein